MTSAFSWDGIEWSKPVPLPDYNWPVQLESDDMKNYMKFLEWQTENNGLLVSAC